MAADIAGARGYEVEIFEGVDAAREMRRVVPFELVQHVADGDVFPFFIAGAPESVFDPDAFGLQVSSMWVYVVFPNLSGIVPALWQI